VSLALYSFLNQIPHQKEPEISVGIFSPTWINSIQLLSTANNYNGVRYLFSSLWLAQFQKPDASEIWDLLQWQQTDLKLRCDCCIKFHLFEGAQDVFSRLTAVCFMLLPNNPYRVSQHSKRHVCGPSCSCKHCFFVDISDFWALVFCQLYWYSMPLKTFLVNN
jgi:hypothetical protein